LFFVFAFFNSGRIYDRPLRDLFEYLVNLTFLVVFFTLTYRAREKSGFVFVFNKMTRIIWISAFLVAALGLVKHLFQVLGISVPLQTQFGTTFNQDKKFFALYSMLGIIGLIPRLIKAERFKKRLFGQSVLLILVLNILFSYSYRSLLLLGIIGLMLIVLQISV